MDQTPIETIGALTTDPDPEQMRFYLAGFGISGALALRPNYMLSGGQKSRVALAALVFKKPHIILMDEPTNHLDVKNVKWVMNYINSLTDTTVVMVSHDSGLLDNCCNNIFI